MGNVSLLIILTVDWVCQMGTLEVFNHKTKHKAVLTFKTTDMFHKDLHKVEGYIYDARYH